MDSTKFLTDAGETPTHITRALKPGQNIDDVQLQHEDTGKAQSAIELVVT